MANSVPHPPSASSAMIALHLIGPFDRVEKVAPPFDGAVLSIPVLVVVAGVRVAVVPAFV